jgi:NhaA family Na+:H+ antiporter
MIGTAIKDFIKSESAIGTILIIAAILAISIVNSSYADYYISIFSGKLFFDFNLKFFINDILMVIFFFLVGLELKKEIIKGELSSKEKMLLPILAALGGIVVPALIYHSINFNNKANWHGWAIPTATDIAFAIGILNLFGNKIANSLKIFLVALAIIDDLAAILIIAVFYSADITLIYLALAFLVTIILLIFNKLKISNLTLYLLAGLALWFLVLKSGIHPTIAGIVLAFFIPDLKMEFLEKKISGFVNYLILPLFALANAGIIFKDIPTDIWSSQLFLSITLGLFFGKQLGVALVVFLLVKLKISPFFKNTVWSEFYGVAILTGIGFTMSLFIGNLAFEQNEFLYNEVRAGVIAGSLLSGLAGFLVIHYSQKIKPKNGKLDY